MSTTSGTPQGTVRLLDEPDVIRKKFRSAVTDSGSEVRRGEDKPGVSEPDRHPLGADRRSRGRDRVPLRRRRLRPVQDRRRRGRRRGGRADPGALPRAAGRRARAAAAARARAPRRPARRPSRRSRRCSTGWASSRARPGASSVRRGRRRPSSAGRRPPGRTTRRRPPTARFPSAALRTLHRRGWRRDPSPFRGCRGECGRQ